MNYLSIDYGTKNIGLAYSVKGIIFTLPPIKNDSSTISNIQSAITANSIDKIYIGISSGHTAKLTQQFINQLSSVIKLPVETVEESVSTIEAIDISKSSQNNKKLVDSVSAAVILRRVIS